MDFEPGEGFLPYRFRYDSLNDQSSDLRLVEILPGKTTGIMICRMHTYTSDQCPSYEALSYAWGDDADKKSIHIPYVGNQGGAFAVTGNLFSALLSLRKCRTGQPEDQRMLIWIDALCIDQQNLEERNLQVQRMKEIYQRAKKVVVYLGDYDEPSDRLLRFAPEIWGINGLENGSYALTLAAFTIATYLSSMSNVANEEEKAEMLAESLQRDRPGNPLTNIRGWAHLSRLFNRPWFERLWIIQELGVSQDAMVLCGGIAVSWSTIEDSAAFILRPHPATPLDIQKFFPLMGAHRVTQVALKNVLDVEKSNLLAVLRHTQGASCSDPRDKLYAIMGVTDDKDDVEIDYNQAPAAVYRKWAMRRIIRTKSLDVLSACADSSQTGELPSWVPDLRRPWAHDRAIWRVTHQLNSHKDKRHPDYFTAILPMHSSWNLENLFPDDFHLSLDGVLLGRISAISNVGDAVTNLADPTNLTSRLKTIVADWEQWYKGLSVSHHPSRTDFRDTLLRYWVWTGQDPTLYRGYHFWCNGEDFRRQYCVEMNLDPATQKSILRNFEGTLFSLVHGFQMFVTDDFTLGVVAGSCNCQAGDEIYALRGGSTPFILRRNTSGHRLISPCYLRGCMGAEARAFVADLTQLEKVILF